MHEKLDDPVPAPAPRAEEPDPCSCTCKQPTSDLNPEAAEADYTITQLDVHWDIGNPAE